MESKTISCKVITPMFSYGGNSAEPELRPTELKGLMRYVYRITQQNVCSKELFTKESELFGSTAMPSPIRLTMEFKGNQPVIEKESLTLHRQRRDWLELNRKKPDVQNYCIDINSTFDITLGYRGECTDADKLLYDNILRLSLYLSGMGKRTRRARGCVCIEGKEKSIEDIREDILNLLNSVAGNTGNSEVKIYYLDDGLCIKPVKLHKELRPLIQKICFGNLVHPNCLDKFLLAIDDAGHKTKEISKARYDDPTGTPNRGSSIIVSATKTTEGYLPIYTYIKAVNVDKRNNTRDEIDKYCKLREEFQNKIETKNGGK